MRVLAALRTAGPSTATALAQRLGLNSGATSYHLRQLAAYGFITEADELGNRRDRFWRVPERETATPGAAASGRGAKAPVTDVDARAAYLQARLIEHTDAAQAAVEGHAALERAWSDATDFATHIVRLDPARAEALFAKVGALVEEAARESDTEQARPYVVQVQGFVAPGEAGAEQE